MIDLATALQLLIAWQAAGSDDPTWLAIAAESHRCGRADNAASFAMWLELVSCPAPIPCPFVAYRGEA